MRTCPFEKPSGRSNPVNSASAVRIRRYAHYLFRSFLAVDDYRDRNIDGLVPAVIVNASDHAARIRARETRLIDGDAVDPDVGWILHAQINGFSFHVGRRSRSRGWNDSNRCAGNPRQ